MTIKSDRWIRQMALEHGMIEPFEEAQVRSGGRISYGVSSFGYDFRVANEWKVFTNVFSTMVDPKDFRQEAFVEIKADHCVIPPNSFALARTVEFWRIPRDVLVICLGKSTYARCGIILNVTPFEPEWEGYATLEISNTTPLPAKIYADEGIGQAIFLQSDEPCETSYRDKGGKYQNQVGIVLPKVEGRNPDEDYPPRPPQSFSRPTHSRVIDSPKRGTAFAQTVVSILAETQNRP